MSLYESIVSGEEKISLVGLGYVGMPIAVAFARKVKVVGFDLNEEKIKLYQSGIDPTKEVGDDVIRQTTVDFTADASKLKEAKENSVSIFLNIIRPDFNPWQRKNNSPITTKTAVRTI